MSGSPPYDNYNLKMIDLSVLPEEPGCYLFHDVNGTIIYIGKAKNLKVRISGYFSRQEKDPKTEALVRSIESLDFIVTDNEVESLILENTLIKKHQPHYNIDLKDSKNYAYISISDEKFPGIWIARKNTGPGLYYGPFVSARERDYILSVVKKTFKLRSCRRIPKRPCLRYHMGSCISPCTGNVSTDEYHALVAKADSVLRGNTEELITTLNAEMAQKSSEHKYEEAIVLRDQITAIKHLDERQHVDRRKSYDEDIINYLIREGVVYLILFHVYRGTLTDKQEYVFDFSDEAVEEFIIQYYSENEPPSELILPKPVSGAITEFLAYQKGKTVRVKIPRRGEKKDLLNLVAKNIELSFFGGETKVEELRKRLFLPEPPVVIECFDISHLAGTMMVGSMVQFRFGRPDKRNYRRFKIKTVDHVDDFAAIAEVVRRRYLKLKNNGDEYPDLIIIDGGKGQLSATGMELEKLGLKIPLISIAKREEEIYVPGFPHPLPIKKNEKASLFVREIRDEAHRFAIKYNRLLRKKEIRDE